MASQSASPTSGTASGGGNVWDNPGNVFATDAVYASSIHGSGTTQDLIATVFGFTIPTGASIDGIAVTVVKGGDGTVIRDLVVRLRNGGAVGDNKADTANDWTLLDETVGYGGPTDTWGRAWTVAEVNAGTFGVQLSANSTSPDTGPRVESFVITVYYTEGVPGADTFPHRAPEYPMVFRTDHWDTG